MPIAIHKDNKPTTLLEEQFIDEDELQASLELNPTLLFAATAHPVTTIQREVQLPAAGNLDLLLIDSEGMPIAVEVKLARNLESRREVLAQAFDYVSALSDLTFEELDDRVQGALTDALEELAGAEKAPHVRKQCAANLRAGRICLIVAVDAANEDLIRIVRYVTEHSDINIRLVSVKKYNQGKILVPQILVEPAPGSFAARAEAPPAKSADPAFAAVINAYDSIAKADLKTRGQTRRYRLIYPDTWPPAFHYEFMDYAGRVGVEIHLESNAVRRFAPLLQSFAGQKLANGQQLEWDPRWSRNHGRLLAKVPKDLRPEVAAQAMRELIRRTQPVIEKQLFQKRATTN